MRRICSIYSANIKRKREEFLPRETRDLNHTFRVFKTLNNFFLSVSFVGKNVFSVIKLSHRCALSFSLSFEREREREKKRALSKKRQFLFVVIVVLFICFSF